QIIGYKAGADSPRARNMPAHRGNRSIERIAAARQHRAARSREHIAGPGGSEPGASWPCSNDASVGCRDNSVRALVYKDGTAPACGRTRLLDLASFQARKGARKLTGMRCQERRRISKPWQC